MNSEKLKEFLREKKIDPEDMATATGMDLSTWYRKLQRNGETFTVKQMNDIIRYTKMSKPEAAEIFFNEKLA